MGERLNTRLLFCWRTNRPLVAFLNEKFLFGGGGGVSRGVPYCLEANFPIIFSFLSVFSKMFWKIFLRKGESTWNFDFFWKLFFLWKGEIWKVFYEKKDPAQNYRGTLNKNERWLTRSHRWKSAFLPFCLSLLNPSLWIWSLKQSIQFQYDILCQKWFCLIFILVFVIFWNFGVNITLQNISEKILQSCVIGNCDENSENNAERINCFGNDWDARKKDNCQLKITVLSRGVRSL